MITLARQGGVCAFPAGYLNVFVDNYLKENIDYNSPYYFLQTLIPGPVVEELLKYFILVFYCLRLSAFDEPMDGLVYGSTAALGFAMIENLLYEVWVVTVFGANEWTVTAFARGMGSTVLHTVGPAIVGFFYAKYHLSNVPIIWTFGLTLGFVSAFVIHGLWNLVGILPLVKTEWELQSFVILFFFTIACIMIVTKLMNKGLKETGYEEGLES